MALLDEGVVPLSRPCTSDETPPEKSISARSVCPNALGSSVATWVPVRTAGLLPVSPVKPALSVPVKLTRFVGIASVASVDSLVTGMTPTTLTVSLPPPMSIWPTMREPLRSVSVSAASVNLIAVPFAPSVLTMAPELTMVLPWLLSKAPMPTLPVMVPALAMLATPALMPNAPPEMAPVFPVTVTVWPKRPPPSAAVAETMPALKSVRVCALMPVPPAEMMPPRSLVTSADS
jgi:hypothetical protein